MEKKPKKIRIDQLLVEKNHFKTRQKAQRVILAGQVLVNDQPITKVGQSVFIDSVIRIKGSDLPYVSRGGLKLEKALDEFDIEVNSKLALDVGASTGGFTDVLLQRGAHKVFTIDVGKNQLDWKIRNDQRVVAKEGVNARYMAFEELGTKVDIIVMDVSFISILKIIPNLKQFFDSHTDLVALIKPQFEVGKDKVGKGGIVRDEEARNEIIKEITKECKDLGLQRQGLIESPITGAQGNIEYLAHWKLV